ncbi:MAG: hypothetical protein H6Q58_450 [Firmicutes bacterium]|nr:hypothetical protein [Bacillota bacterium]
MPVKKKAIISVTSKQRGDNDEIKVVTPGTFYVKDDVFYAEYAETEISGMEGTTTTMEIRPNKFSLIRQGSTSTEMEFDRKENSVSMYNTPYGTLELKIETKKLDVMVDEEGGDIFIKYLLCVVGQDVLDTTLKINIKTQE